MALPQEKIYTLEDIYALPDGERAELIDGRIYNMAPPNRIHQKISWKLHQTIANYISSKKGSCEVYAAPFSLSVAKYVLKRVPPASASQYRHKWHFRPPARFHQTLPSDDAVGKNNQDPDFPLPALP